jgi:hypothetical protein
MQRGLRERVCVDAEEEWAIDIVLLPILANSLRDRKYVPLVEGPIEG